MQVFVLVTFLIITLAPYAVESLGAPQPLKYSPELMSGLLLPYIFLQGTRRRFASIAPKYWGVFAAISIVVICGVVANGVDAVPLATGLRFYIRALPLFFLPAVFEFSEAQLLQQLRLLLFLGLLQCPIAIAQRWLVLSQGRFSGDAVQGTLLDSGGLTIFLICSALVATGMYLRGYLDKLSLFAVLFILLLPTTINETKVTAIYVPIGFTVLALAGAAKGHRTKIIAWTCALLAAFGILFVSIYNLMELHNPYKNERDIVAFFSNQKQLNRYMTSDVTGVGTKKDIRRGDALSVPLAFLARDPIQLALGVGLGNASPSTLSRNDEGAFYELFRPFLLTSFTYFILEIGVLGVAGLLVLYWLVFQDALKVSHEPGLVGALAVGWTATTVLMCISLVYSLIHTLVYLSYLFWYFSGLIAAQRSRLAQAQPRIAPA